MNALPNDGAPIPNFEITGLTSYASQALEILQPLIIKSDDVFYGFKGKSRIICRPNSFQQKGSVVPDTRHIQHGDTIEIIVEPQATYEHAEKYDELQGDVAKTMVSAGVAKALYGWNISYQLGKMNDSEKSIALKNINQRLTSRSALNHIMIDTSDDDLKGFIDRMADREVSRVNVLRFAFGAALRHVVNGGVQLDITERARYLFREDMSTLGAELDFESSWNDMDAAFQNYDDKVPHIELALGYPMSPAEETDFVADIL